MKRCPQCEFIYEDEQSLCDMDGALLVFDARSLPNFHALATVDVPLAPKAPWRHRTFPAMAALILATVLSLVYFVSTTRTAPAPAPLPISGASLAQPIAEPVAPASETNQTLPPAAAAAEVNSAAVTVKEETKPEPARTNTPRTATATKSVAKTQTTEPKPADEPKKEDSKVGSILKKTGRILKKPFKF